jgi:hypothetical protein
MLTTQSMGRKKPANGGAKKMSFASIVEWVTAGVAKSGFRERKSS